MSHAILTIPPPLAPFPYRSDPQGRPARIAPDTLPLPAPTDVYQVHHWLIAGQNGVTSEGVCKRCGAHRQFNNAFGWTHPSKLPMPKAGSQRNFACCAAAVAAE